MNTAVVFDASGSSAAGGGDLQYFWDFGGGRHGGGEIIARQFATPGANIVTLTVVDGGGRSATQSKTITIAAPTSAPATVTAQGSITDVAEVALQGVTVTPFGAPAGATTDAMGKVSVSLAVGVPLALKLSKDGYADQFVSLQMPETAGADAYFEAVMRPRDAALTLPNAAAGGSLAGRDGATITLPANALVDANNAPVTGAVQIAMTPVDITQPGAGGFPGSFDGIMPSGVTTPIVSYGTTEYVLTANGGSLQLAPGKTAIIEMPLYASENLDGTTLTAGDTTPLWSLDEATGIWVQEGTGTVVASTSSPTGLALRATVSHFTWWNSDLGFDPYGPQPRCVYDDDIGIPGANDTFATATICNMLAEIDRTLGGAGSAKMSIAAEAPRFVGFSRRALVPIAGGVTIPVPANADVALSATALNGTWVGRTVVNGAVGVQAPVLIEMRPLDSTGPDPDTVVLPFDGSRTLETNQAALFNFNGVALRFARITVTPISGSSLAGSVRLLQGASVLATTTYGGFNPQPIIAMLPAATLYTVEVTGTSGTPGGYRLQIELTGTSTTDALTVPFRIDNGAVPQLTVVQKTFDVATPITAHIAFQQRNNENARGSLTGPSGLLYNFSRIGADRTEATTLNLAPGSYSLTVGGARGSAAAFSAKVERTQWEQIGPPLEGIVSTFDLIDAVADRNGRPVLGYIRTFVANAHTSAALTFKRWSGSAWQDVGTELIVDEPCSSNAFVSFAFDSANNPVVAYGNQQASASFTSVRRFSAGAWQPIGPNNGALPVNDAFAGACRVTPIVQIGASDQAFVAYQGGNDFHVQRFDGTNWVDVVPGGSTFASANSSTYDLRVDGNDRLWFVLTTPTGFVRRFNPTPTPAWETVGPNGGELPAPANTGGIYGPRLRFDASGNPLIGATVAIGNGVYSSGVIVYRYDGTLWSTTGGFQSAGPNSRSSGDRTHTFAVWNNEAITAWINNFSGTTADTVLLAQRNTPSGWTAIGADDGRVPQFTPDGTVSQAAITQLQAWQTRMVAIGSELYMGVVVTSTTNDGTPRRVYLLRKTAD